MEVNLILSTIPSTIVSFIFLQQPPRIDGEKSEPESLAFKDKWKRFEKQIDEQVHSTPKASKNPLLIVLVLEGVSCTEKKC